LLLLISGLVLSGAAADPEDQVREIAAQLRCPVCQNLSVADSPSELANQMRGVIRDRLRAGQTQEQIQAYFVEKYGEWVLLAPTKTGFNLLAWVLPFVGVLAGGAAVAVLVRRWSGPEGAAEGAGPPAEDAAPPDTEDARYRDRLRRELEDFAR
jgi:cytochrome c-type biogenesis protein CcmH